jgi:hypothetical protein
LSASSDGIRIRPTRTDISIPSVMVESPLGSKQWKPHRPPAKRSSTGGRQKTVSQSHHRNKNGSWDGGGPFFTSRTYVEYANTSVSCGPKTLSGTPATYSGPVGFALPPGEVEKVAAFMKQLGSEDTSGLNPKGATAISLCQPTRSAASLATGLAELVREGSPSLPGIKTWKGRTDLARAAGDEYLNAVFGWLPLTKEVKEVSSNISKSAQIAKQYARDSGKDVRRGFDFDEENSSTGPTVVGSAQATIGGTLPDGSSYSFNDFNNGELGDVVLETSVSKRVWFRGAFTYHVPSDGDSYRGLERQGALADHVVGLNLTPSVLWELTPWSWAVDWFSNTGRVIDNVTAFGQYGLVMRYGYIMEHSIEKCSYTLKKSCLYGADQKSVGPVSFVRETKTRSPANPFGFGIGWEGLSPSQLAITAALGITRLRS